jgi:hypothetical protein
MHFGITKLKFAISLFTAIAFGFYFSIILGFGQCFDCSRDVYTRSIIRAYIFGSIIAFIPIYLLWSFFDKKTSSKIGKYVGIAITVISVMLLLVLITLFLLQIMF